MGGFDGGGGVHPGTHVQRFFRISGRQRGGDIAGRGAGDMALLYHDSGVCSGYMDGGVGGVALCIAGEHNRGGGVSGGICDFDLVDRKLGIGELGHLVWVKLRDGGLGDIPASQQYLAFVGRDREPWR